MVPLLCSFIWLLGFMYAFDMKINFYNIVVLAAMFGIGIDISVHIFHRYKEEGVGGVNRVLSSTAGAILSCTLTTLLGFSGLISAWHVGLKSMGYTALIGLSICLISSLLFFPAILLYYESQGIPLCLDKEKEEEAEEEISISIPQPQEAPAE